MEFDYKNFKINIVDESETYSFESRDNSRKYDYEYILDEGGYSVHGINCKSDDGKSSSCVISAPGGLSGVHDNTATIEKDVLYIAVGNSICAVTLPTLQKKWHQEVDDATCFGVYYVPEDNSLISHGELDITKLDTDGEIQWSSGGKDIFSEGFEIDYPYIYTTDFNKEIYEIDIHTGDSKIV